MEIMFMQSLLLLPFCISLVSARVSDEEAKRLVKIHADKMKCRDHPTMCNYYYTRGFYDHCSVGGVKWYFCPKSCGYCDLLDAGSPIPTPQPGCRDLEGICPKMAKYGECDPEENFVRMFCRKSCKFCLQAPPCFDKDELCGEFAKDGMCYLEPVYMRQFCEKSCDFCIKPTFPPKNICEDKDPEFCSKEMSKPDTPCTYGEKTIRKKMSMDCRKSCNMCTKTGDCFDENSLCPYYVKTSDYCTNKTSEYHTFMLEKCKYSCGICKD